MARIRYSKKMLEDASKECNTFREVAVYFGLKPHGGTLNHLKNRMIYFEVDFSHFTTPKMAVAKVNQNRKLAPKDILRVRKKGSYRAKTKQLRRALLEIGVPHICATCGQEPIWNGKPLVLEIEHIDGDYTNCLRENLEFICPHCHTQTKTYKSKNLKKGDDPAG